MLSNPIPARKSDSTTHTRKISHEPAVQNNESPFAAGGRCKAVYLARYQAEAAQVAGAEFCWSAHFAPFLSMNRALSVELARNKKRGKRGKCKKGKKVGGPVSRVSLQCNPSQRSAITPSQESGFLSKGVRLMLPLLFVSTASTTAAVLLLCWSLVMSSSNTCSRGGNNLRIY